MVRTRSPLPSRCVRTSCINATVSVVFLTGGGGAEPRRVADAHLTVVLGLLAEVRDVLHEHVALTRSEGRGVHRGEQLLALAAELLAGGHGAAPVLEAHEEPVVPGLHGL